MAYDLETTGLSEMDDEVIEACFIEFNKQGEIGRQFYSLCEPYSGFIPTDATAIHGIHMRDVLGKPNYFDIRDNIIDFVNSREFGGHNSDWFDLKMLHVELDGVPTFDTMVTGAEKFNMPDGRISLRALCKKLGVKFDKALAHRAEYDVIKCLECHCALMKTDREAVMETKSFWEV